jgi:hypothetical protein
MIIGPARPLKVVLVNKLDRNEILKNARKLKGNDEHTGIGISKDMTPREREQDRQLRDELKRKREEGGGTKWMISNGRVVPDRRPTKVYP